MAEKNFQIPAKLNTVPSARTVNVDKLSSPATFKLS